MCVLLLTPTKPFYFAARPSGVDHGSHNVSRWMTWLSISLKNAAACDKWYQLQNHSITESLNANGAWEKPFVGHPRACHTQCRTNKKKHPHEPKRGALLKQESELRRGAPWRVAVWLGVCCARAPVLSQGRPGFTSREAGAAKHCSKRNIAFSLCQHILILFTDLSMAGLPAELKHITQRRKRKQP